MENKSKKISLSFYILLLLFVQVIISDMVIYFTNIKYITGQITALFINIAINYFLIKKDKIKITNSFEKHDFIFITIFILFVCSTIIFPDEFYDSYSYHIYMQKNAFNDKVNEDFFPGRTLTSYTYAIADRLYCLFSNKLGFRLGTLPSYYILVVLYYQIKKILRKLNENIEPKICCFVSILPLFSIVILQQVGTYYVDNICITLLLEFSYVILFEYSDFLKNKSNIYFLAFISGLLVSVKFTNAFYLILPLIFIIFINIKEIKSLKWYDYITICIVGILPLFVYMFDAIKDVGSPFFPYYNSIFKSKYFGEYDWFDTTVFGPKNILQLLLWPLYITLNPLHGYDIPIIDLNFSYGYILAFIVLGKGIYKKIKNNINFSSIEYLSIMIIYYNFILAKFCIGYIRYGGIIIILSAIALIYYLLKFIEIKNTIFVLLLSLVLSMGIYHAIDNCKSFSKMSYYFDTTNSLEEKLTRVKINVGCLLKDQDYLKYDIDGIWGVIGDDSAVPAMLNIDDNIVQLRDGVMIGETQISEEIYFDKILNNDIYVPIYKMKENDKISMLQKHNFEIIEVVDVLPNVLYMLDASQVTILKVKYNPNAEKSVIEQYNEALIKYQESF